MLDLAQGWERRRHPQLSRTVPFREGGCAGHTYLAKRTQAFPAQVIAITVSHWNRDCPKRRAFLTFGDHFGHICHVSSITNPEDIGFRAIQTWIQELPPPQYKLGVLGQVLDLSGFRFLICKMRTRAPPSFGCCED